MPRSKPTPAPAPKPTPAPAPKPTPAPAPKPTPAPAPKGLIRALLIGINYVENTNNRLYGCVNDIINIKSNINKLYPSCTNIRSLSDEDANVNNKPTRKNIIDSIAWLTSGLKSGDSVLFHYSGHGGRTIDISRDEKSGYDSCIYPISNGTIESIIDDELRALLVNKIPTGCKCFAILDCCHSGSALDLRYMYNAPSYGQLIMTQNKKYSKTNGSVIFISGCTDVQTAADTVNEQNIPSGALTNALLKVWNTYGTNIKFKHMLWDIRTLLKENGYSQIPELSCSNNINMSNIFKL
jgi:hypothetical protein